MSAPFNSIHSLIAWLEKQPPEGEYDYRSNNECLIGQYFKALGIGVAPNGIGPYDWWDTNGKTHLLSAEFRDTAIGRPRTFGAALTRARAVAAP